MNMPPGWEEGVRRRQDRFIYWMVGIVTVLFVATISSSIITGFGRPQGVLFAFAPFAVMIGVILMVRAYGRRHPGSWASPSMLAAVDAPTRRVIRQALRRGTAVSRQEYAMLAVESAARIRRARWLPILMNVVAIIFFVDAAIARSVFSASIDVLAGVALLASAIYQLWLVRQAGRAEAANRAIAQPGYDQT